MPEPVLKLRRATVVRLDGVFAGEQELRIRLDDGRERSAIADARLLGRCEVGDELIVNVQAVDLALGSGGFDVVHVNLTKGLSGEGAAGAHVMKLNYTSLQHAVVPVEELEAQSSRAAQLKTSLSNTAVGVLALHGQLPALAWAFAQSAPAGAKLGFVQTPGGALPGGHSRVVRALLERGLLAGHLTAGAAYGGRHEAITTAGALRHAASALGWAAIVCGPGPGIVGSGSLLGHGGMHALDSAHTALALGARTTLVARMSSSDPRARHQGISHHTMTVLELLLAPVTVALPAECSSAKATSESIHDWRTVAVDLDSYAASGLPTQTMGRAIQDDQPFFAAALAGGAVLAESLGAHGPTDGP
jgi:Protein of unknown function (DUF3866)